MGPRSGSGQPRVTAIPGSRFWMGCGGAWITLLYTHFLKQVISPMTSYMDLRLQSYHSHWPVGFHRTAGPPHTCGCQGKAEGGEAWSLHRLVLRLLCDGSGTSLESNISWSSSAPPWHECHILRPSVGWIAASGTSGHLNIQWVGEEALGVILGWQSRAEGCLFPIPAHHNAAYLSLDVSFCGLKRDTNHGLIIRG